MPTASRTYPYAALAAKYVEDIVGERIPACLWVRLACERQVRDLETFRGDSSPYYFDRAAANRVCDIIQRFPHIKGIWAQHRKKLELEPWQCFIICTVFGWMCAATKTRRFRVAYVEIPRKNAKALALDTPIPTPTGWATIGDVQVGDAIFDPEGNPARVTAVSETFTDHDCYELEFSNGERIVADAGHIWRTQARVNQVGVHAGRQMGARGQSVISRDRTTQEVFDTQTYGERNDRNHSIAPASSLALPDADLLIEPYVLGAWLGDGTSAAAHITCGSEDLAEMAAQIRHCGYAVKLSRAGAAWRVLIQGVEVDLLGDRIVGTKSTANVQARLRGLGVLNSKHIPANYLRASLSQRLALLQGLMDTDGTISRSGLCISFTTVSERLASGVQELLSTLGLKHRTRHTPLVCNGVPVPGVAHLIQFHSFRDELPVFRLPRKLGRMRLRSEAATAPRSRSIQICRVAPIASVPVRCLTVDSPTHMFLCGRSMVPTHNSTLTSALGNYLVACDNEAGAYVVSAANTRDQAKLVFTDAQIMARREAGFRSKFGVEVLAHTIVQTETASKFEALSAEHSNLDGLNIHAALIDELHAHPTRGLWDVLETATGSRSQSLIWAITTAGMNRASVCYDQRTHAIEMLKRIISDESYFGIIYTRDDDDDPWDEATWMKCNPNYGISIYPETMRATAARAQTMPSQQNAFLTRHLNIWVNADTAWLPAGAWDKCGDPDLDIEDFARDRCYIGIDLALRSDIAALVIAFPPTARRDWWAVFGRYYLPEQTVQRSENNHYQGWEIEGRMVATPGAVTDFDFIIDQLEDYASRFDLIEIALDPYHAGPLVTTLEKRGLPTPVQIRQSAPNMSPAMVEMEGLVLSGRIRHDGDPVLAWMMSNVTAHRSGDLMQPRKESDEKKIDGVTALLMCLHRGLKQGGGGERADYENRGLWAI
jgi:phage terminase large subunit-like protein